MLASFKIKRKRLIVLMVIVSGIGGCFYSASRPSWIEWDDHDPKLHGQIIRFNKPMKYVTLDPEWFYGTVAIEIKNKLLDEKDARELAKMSDVQLQKGTVAEVYVISSFWLRQNWWIKSFAGHIRFVVVQDNAGTQSIMTFWEFANSDRPDLLPLKDEGYLKWL